MGLAAVAIRFVEQQIPARVQGIDLELVILMGVPIRIDEHFEIRIIENHRIVIRERCPDVRFFEFGGNIQIIFIPKQLCASAEAGFGFCRALDINKVGGPLGSRPSPLVETSVNLDLF